MARLPYGMFDVARSAREARRADKLSSIYHRGQQLAWVGTEVLPELIAKHGGIQMEDGHRRALGRIFSILMWGELAAWKVSAQLAAELEPLEAKMAATSQAHDEARHFYVLHDYLAAIDAVPDRPDPHTEAALHLVLGTRSLAQKLMGMQLLIEPIALTIFHTVRHLQLEPVLCELLIYYERDEARHVGLGVQALPELVAALSPPARARLFVFQLQIIYHVLRSLKALEPDLRTLGMTPRDLLELGMSKQEKATRLFSDELGIDTTIPREVARRVVGAACELAFPRTRRRSWQRLGDALSVLRRGPTVADAELTEVA